MAVDLAAAFHLGQHAHGNAQPGADGLVPAQAADVVEHGAAGVGVVGHMHPAAGELPDEPGVHRAEEQPARLGLFSRAGHVLQNPLDLGGGEVGVHQQARVVLHIGGELRVLFQRFAKRGGAPALPHDGVVNRTAGLLVPDDGGLPLVGDADAGDLPHVHPALSQHLHQHAVLAGVYLHGVVLHPAGMGIVLGEFLLGKLHDVLVFVEQDAAAAGGALVQGDHVLFHGEAPPFLSALRRARARRFRFTSPTPPGRWWTPPPRPPAWRP